VEEEGVVTQTDGSLISERGCYTTKSSLFTHSSLSPRFFHFVEIDISIRLALLRQADRVLLLLQMARTRGADRGGGPESSLDAAMRAPSTQQPDVVVLDFAEEEPKVRDISDPKKDLWLSTSDGLVLPF